MSSPLITTIITTYKRPQLLKKTLQSVLNQTFSNFKVCVYDNASNDDTEEIMREFVKNDSRVHYHRHENNIGMMQNYAYALAKVDTPYFSFLSDDDCLLPWFYETALEGFKKHSEAAFSACEVLAIDEKGNIIASPLSEWKKEGLYEVPEGVLAMVEEKSRLPVPTAVLFQHKKVKSILPDWSKEMQLMWDPDYLLQIACQHSIVINKKPSGLFMAHSSSFSSEFYKKLVQSPKYLEDYIRITQMIIQRIMENPHVSVEHKKIFKKALVEMVRKEFTFHVKSFTFHKNFKGAYSSARLFHNYYEFDRYMHSLLPAAFVYIYIPFIRPPVRFVVNLFRKKKPVIQTVKSQDKSKPEFNEYIESFIE